MKKLFLTFSLFGSLLFINSCQRLSEEEVLAADTYLKVKEELNNNLELCSLNRDNVLTWLMYGAKDPTLQAEVQYAFLHYNELVSALSSVGISLEFTYNSYIPKICRLSEQTLKFNIGSSSILRRLAEFSLREDGQPSHELMQYGGKIDVIQIAISRDPERTSFYTLREKNAQGLERTIVRIEVNPLARKVTINAKDREEAFDKSHVLKMLMGS